jgi:alanine dehydrogenase
MIDMVLVLSERDIGRVLELTEITAAVEEALVKQATGRATRPERPHFTIGTGLENDDPLGTGLVMPAYIHGHPQYVTKLVSLNEGNERRGLPTLHAQIVLIDAQTGVPDVFMDGTMITNARTGCIGGLAVRELAPEAGRIGVLGAGAQARWQIRAIDTIVELTEVKIHSPSTSRNACATDLREEGIPATAVDTATDAIQEVDIVVTATTSTHPVFPADTLADGTLVVGIGAYNAETQELEPVVFKRAARVFADVPEEMTQIGDLLATDLTEENLVPFGGMLANNETPKPTDELLIVESVGSATLDAAAARIIYERAQENRSGTEIQL